MAIAVHRDEGIAAAAAAAASPSEATRRPAAAHHTGDGGDDRDRAAKRGVMEAQLSLPEVCVCACFVP